MKESGKVRGKGRRGIRFFAIAFALGLILQGVAPAARVQAAAPEAFIFLKGTTPQRVFTKTAPRYMYVGGQKSNFDYSIDGKTKGIKGTWTSSDEKIATVNKNGVVKAVGNGSTTIYFTFTYKGQSYSMKTYVKCRTRAATCTVSVVDPEDFDGTMEIGDQIDINRKLTPVEKAKAINPSIKSTYKTYGTLYDDEACTIEHDGSVASMEPGFIITGESDGVVYFRANARNNKTNMDYNVNSNIIKITVGEGASEDNKDENQDENNDGSDGGNNGNTTETNESIVTGASQTDVDKIKVTSTADISKITIKIGSTTLSQKAGSPAIAADKKSAIVSLPGNYQSNTYTIFINDSTEGIDVKCTTRTVDKIVLDSKYAVLDKEAATIVNNVTVYPKATLKYKVYDQFGNDITTNPSYPVSDFTCGGLFQMVSQGVMEFQFPYNPTIGTKYDITIVHPKSAKVLNEIIELAKPAYVEKASFAGIYRYDAAKGGYVLMTDGNTTNMAEGDNAITAFGGSHANTKTNGAYYVLFKAENQYGGNAAGPGVGYSSMVVNLSGGMTGLTLDKVTYNGVNEIQSVDAISVDNVDYLAYPLAAGSYKEGTAFLTAFAVGAAANVTATITVGPKKGIQTFSVSAMENAYELKETYLDYSVTDTTGNLVTDYATLVEYSGLTDGGTVSVFGAGSTIISSTGGSSFAWVRQDDGTAKLRYTPADSSAKAGSDNVVYQDQIRLMTGTINFKYLTVSVYEKPVPANIYGIEPNATLGALVGGNQVVLRLRDLQIVDQYGAKMTPELVKNSGYYIHVSGYSNNAGAFSTTSLDATAKHIDASVADSLANNTGIYQPVVTLTTSTSNLTGGTATFNLRLSSAGTDVTKVGSEYSISMRSVPFSNIVKSSYQVTSLGKLNNGSAYDAGTVYAFEVTGLAADGTRIAIPEEKCTIIGSGNAGKFLVDATKTVSGNSITYTGINPTAVALDSSARNNTTGLNISTNSNGVRELTCTYTVVIDDGIGSYLTASVIISDERAYAASLEIVNPGATMTINCTETVWAQLISKGYISAKDQYGKAYTLQSDSTVDVVRITVSGSSGTNVKKNGTQSARVTTQGTVTVRINVNNIDAKTISVTVQ